MPILRVQNPDGSWSEIPALVGPAGPQGERGEAGPAGPQGERGETGPAGPAGADGTMSFEDLTAEQRESLRGPQGIQGERGETGPQGERGETGPAGAAGKTPVKGEDYWTAADKAEMVQAVLAALPNAEEASF